jgi:uncharacterized protein
MRAPVPSPPVLRDPVVELSISPIPFVLSSNGAEKGHGARRKAMAVQLTTIMIGVKDLARAKKFYGEGLGCTIDQDYPNFVSFGLGEGSSSLALYEWEAAAQDAGVSAEGSGFRGVSFHFIVSSSEAVDEVIARAAAAGGAVVRQAAASPYGYFGYFSDPDGYLWKVATGA